MSSTPRIHRASRHTLLCRQKHWWRKDTCFLSFDYKQVFFVHQTYTSILRKRSANAAPKLTITTRVTDCRNQILLPASNELTVVRWRSESWRTTPVQRIPTNPAALRTRTSRPCIPWQNGVVARRYESTNRFESNAVRYGNP